MADYLLVFVLPQQYVTKIKVIKLKIDFKLMIQIQIVLTFPPAAVRAAKQNNVDISLFPSIWNRANDAA